MSICIPKDLADQLLAALGCKGLSGASQASSSTDTTAEPNTAALTTQMTRDVIQAIQAAEHVERPLSAPNTLRHVMTWFTQNTAPRELNFIKDAVSFDWMGTARIYLSPLNIGFENLATALKDGSYTVDWIRVKLLSITLSTAESSRAIVETDDYTLGQSTWIGNDGDARENIVSLDGTTYTIGYWPAATFLGRDDLIQDAANGFVRKPQSTTSGQTTSTTLLYGEGFTTQTITGLNSQYKGMYAAEAAENKTERLGVASELVIRNPTGYPLALVSTQLSNGQVQNDVTLQGTPSTFTKSQTRNFMSKQATEPSSEAIAVSDAVTPLYGMVQIDLPEDLIQDVYQKVKYNATVVPMANGTGSDDLEMCQVTTWTNKVLNANYNVLVEYGITQN